MSRPGNAHDARTRPRTARKASLWWLFNMDKQPSLLLTLLRVLPPTQFFLITLPKAGIRYGENHGLHKRHLEVKKGNFRKATNWSMRTDGPAWLVPRNKVSQ
ncbi:hypothetical protein BC827DRAFT_1157945 [Russula dissimulans]|nr:hypothetical protein BC827DRAFT_1157945 [Russula dissimulans]